MIHSLKIVHEPYDAVLPGIRFQDVLVHGQHRDHDLGIFRHLGDAAGTLGTSVHDLVHGFPVDVVDRELVALLHQVLGHEAAHVAEADEPDIGKVSTLTETIETFTLSQNGAHSWENDHVCKNDGSRRRLVADWLWWEETHGKIEF